MLICFVIETTWVIPVRTKEHRQATSPQTGQQPTDGLLVAQRRATSPETGYYEIARLWATSPETGQQPTDGLLQKFAKIMIFSL